MGFRICWLGFSGKRKADVLGALRAKDTGLLDEANESPMSIARLPNNWTIIWLNRFDHPLASEASIQSLSKNCTLVTAHVNESTMFSSTQLHANGAQLWSITHSAKEGMYNLQTSGTLPEFYSEISARLTGKQDQNGGDKSKVDYIFDVPVEVAKSVCGYRYNLCRYDWGEPYFTTLRELGPSASWQFWRK
ncbi:MAG TPA: hypothetical protein VMF58_08710 [Rhizomicrobium sp.]|nr:hypothetical protein [Rhizomicrobium sp.]